MKKLLKSIIHFHKFIPENQGYGELELSIIINNIRELDETIVIFLMKLWNIILIAYLLSTVSYKVFECVFSIHLILLIY